MIPLDTPNPEPKSEFLYPLQRRILLFFAEKSPMNKHATAKAMGEHTRSTWLSIMSLVKIGLVKKVDQRASLGRERDCFWLTDAGVYLALIEGANPKKVLNKSLEVYPEYKLLHLIIEITPILGTSMHKIGYSVFLNKGGKPDDADRNAMRSAQLSKELSLEQISELMTILRKYPEQTKDIEGKLMEMLNKLKEAETFLKNEVHKTETLKES